MTYLINILDIIKSSIGYYPIQWILLTINILLFFTVKVLYQYEYNGIDYKIYNHLFNKVNNIIYIIVFLLILLYLRYLRWGYTIELIPLFEKYPVLGIKSQDFLDFKKAAELIKNKAHLEESGLAKILLIKSIRLPPPKGGRPGMNRGR